MKLIPIMHIFQCTYQQGQQINRPFNFAHVPLTNCQRFISLSVLFCLAWTKDAVHQVFPIFPKPPSQPIPITATDLVSDCSTGINAKISKDVKQQQKNKSHGFVVISNYSVLIAIFVYYYCLVDVNSNNWWRWQCLRLKVTECTR